jgi:hypothetical protein
MKLLILADTKYDNKIYRGTDRNTPYYHEELEELHEVNQAFIWFCSEVSAGSVVHDLEKAKRLVKAYKHLPTPERFELIEVTTGVNQAVNSAQFLGYDLSANYSLSLLSLTNGLISNLSKSAKFGQEIVLQKLEPLSLLVERHFQPQLNENGLFDDYEVAKDCLGCMMSLQFFYPSLYEHESVKFEVVGIWKMEV